MSRQVVRNSKGTIIYWTNSHMGVTKVYNIHNVLLGWCENGQTRDAKGTLTAQNEVPGLLVSSH